MDDSTATFQIGESTYEFITTTEMDYEEARIVKRLTGAGLGSFEVGIADGDPTAWFAEVYISLRRTNSRITEQQVNDLLAGQKLVAIYKSLTKVEQEDEPDPPASAPSSDNGGNNDGGTADEHASSEETPETPGSQT